MARAAAPGSVSEARGNALRNCVRESDALLQNTSTTLHLAVFLARGIYRVILGQRMMRE